MADDMKQSASERNHGNNSKLDLDWIGHSLWLILQIVLLPVQEFLAAWRGDRDKQDPSDPK